MSTSGDDNGVQFPEIEKEMSASDEFVFHLARFPSEKAPRAFKSVESAMAAAAAEINLPAEFINWEPQGDSVWLARNGSQMIAIQKMRLEP